MKPFLVALLVAIIAGSPKVVAQKHNITADTTLARKWYEQAMTLQESGKYDSSNVLLRQAVALYGNHQQWEKKLDNDNELSFNLILLGKYQQALEQAQRTLAEGEKRLSQGNTFLASSYNNLGIIYQVRGEYDKALEYYQQALQIRLSTLGELHLNVANAYNNMGGVYYQKGEYNKALAYLQKALEIRLKIHGETHPIIAAAYSNIGIVYKDRGEPDKALEFHKKALQIRVTAFGEFHPELANSYNNIGAVYDDKSEYDKALEYYQKSLRIKIKAFGKFHPEVANTYNNIGIVYLNKGEYDKAVKPYQQAILANVPSFQDTLVAYNPTFTSQANNYLKGGYLLTSLRGKASALSELSATSAASHATQNLLLAYQTLQVADTISQQMINSYSVEQDKVTFLSEATQAYQQALSVCLKLYALTKDQTYLDKAFYFASRGKASVLSASLAESKAKNFASIPDSLLAKDQHLKGQLSHYQQLLAEELSKGKEVDNLKLQEYQGSLFTTRLRQDSLIRYFEEHYPQYYELKYKATPVTLQQLQQKLDNQTAVIEYVLGDSTLHILTLTHSAFDITSAAVDSSFRRDLTAFRKRILTQDQEQYVSLANKLFKQLWPKALPATICNVIIIPDGPLTTLPFEALLTSVPKKSNKKQPYLLQAYVLSYAYSTSLLYEQLITPKVLAKNHSLLALAPVFTSPTTNTPARATRDILWQNQPLEETNSASIALATSGNRTDSLRPMTASTTTTLDVRQASVPEVPLRGYVLQGVRVAPLPASEGEVTSIARLFRAKGSQVEVYLHDLAKEEQLKRDDLSKYSFMHLATHGFVNRSRPELSGLLLAQDSTSNEDGILYSGEIYNLKMNAELVTLSACETGLGKLAQGEGLIGLSRALLYAGARNINISLWKVHDESTAQFMKYFYKQLLKGHSKPKALQEAKLHLIKQSHYSAPFYWAPFVLVGW